MHVGRFQVIGLVGIALFALGAVLAIVLPQMSPSYGGAIGLAWPLFLIGGVLFWVGVIGGVVEAFRGLSRRPGIPPAGLPPPPR